MIENTRPHRRLIRRLRRLLLRLLCSIALTLLGLTPTTEGLFESDLRALIENVAALVILTAAPAAVAYYKRNYLK